MPTKKTEHKKGDPIGSTKPVNLLATIRRYDPKIEYIVGLQFRDRTIGGLPNNPEGLRDFLKLRDAPDELIDPATRKQAEADIEGEEGEKPETLRTVFGRDEEGRLFIGAYQIKAMVKELAKTLGINRELVGSRNKTGAKQIMQDLWIDGVLPADEGVADNKHNRGRVYLLPGGYDFVGEDGLPAFHLDHVLTEPAGYEVRVGRASGPQGERSFIKEGEYVEEAQLFFRIRVFDSMPGFDTDAAVGRILAAAGESGLGAWRSQGYGTFDPICWVRLDEASAFATHTKDRKGQIRR